LKLFVSEYVCSGAWPEREISCSLAVEGRSMLAAILADFASIPGVDVFTTWDRRLGAPTVESVQTSLIDSPAQEQTSFERLARECEASFVIAPETHGVLAQRAAVVVQSGNRLLGPAPAAISLCADKLELCRHLQQHGIPTIETAALRLEDSNADDFEFPIVVKPTDGAGSQDTVLVWDRTEFERLCQTRRQSSPLQDIWQPFVRGTAVSTALLMAPDGIDAEVFPPAEQFLSDDGRFGYSGGRIPARCPAHNMILQSALAACRAVPGLRGYVGVDLVVPDAALERPVVVEINPRLTTSYLGYRVLAQESLAERMLFPDRFAERIVWRAGGVEFDAAGAARLVEGTGC
jgi:tyramine---L-glutamate ligase